MTISGQGNDMIKVEFREGGPGSCVQDEVESGGRNRMQEISWQVIPGEAQGGARTHTFPKGIGCGS